MSLLLRCQLHYNAFLTLLSKCGEWSYTICSFMHSKILCVYEISIIVENPCWPGSFSLLPWMTGILPVYSSFTLQIIFYSKETHLHYSAFYSLRTFRRDSKESKSFFIPIILSSIQISLFFSGFPLEMSIVEKESTTKTFRYVNLRVTTWSFPSF